MPPFGKNGYVVACPDTREAIVIDPGDEVLVADPSYPCNRRFAESFGGRVRLLETTPESRFQLDAAGVTGAGLATLAGGLQAHRPELLGGVGIIVGIDRFMSEARALTNFIGNAVATVLVGTWTKTVDHDRVRAVLDGRDPFDYAAMTGEHS